MKDKETELGTPCCLGERLNSPDGLAHVTVIVIRAFGQGGLLETDQIMSSPYPFVHLFNDFLFLKSQLKRL